MLLNRPISVKYILNTIKFEMLYVLLLSLAMYYLTHRFREILPEIPLTIPTFIGTAISILLSFKVSQSYDRWWEARKVWGAIVNDSRSFVVQLQTLIPRGNESIVKKIAYRQIAWCYCLGQSLRGLKPAENLDTFISKEEIEEIVKHRNTPLALIQLHGYDIAALKTDNKIDIFTQLQLDETLVRFVDSMGKAERIKTTVFPVTYRLFLHLMIYLFVITLSISLSGVGQFKIPLLLMLSAAFFLLEKTATHMQDPFNNKPTDTAMTAIARTIEINIRHLLKETDVPQPHAPSKFYLS